LALQAETRQIPTTYRCTDAADQAEAGQTPKMKSVGSRSYSDPEAAARKLVELANAFDPIQDGRIYIEKLNGPMLFDLKATPTEYSAGLKRAIERGWLVLHESGTFVRFTQAGADLFA
jgi:hypothetical protein